MTTPSRAAAIEEAARYAAEYVVSRTTVFGNGKAVVAEAVRLTLLSIPADAGAKCGTVERFKCPECDGTGKVSRPPWIAGDQGEWVSSGTAPYSCGACVGTGVVWSPQ